jgi:microcystin-dependent protein
LETKFIVRRVIIILIGFILVFVGTVYGAKALFKGDDGKTPSGTDNPKETLSSNKEQEFDAYLKKKGLLNSDGNVTLAGVRGSVYLYAGSKPPAGYLLCDGTAVSRTEYKELFALIGTTYGPGDGTSTFNLPDLQGKVVIGGSTEFPIGAKGGANQYTLSVSQLPNHWHSFTDVSGVTDISGAHSHIYSPIVPDTSAPDVGVTDGAIVTGSGITGGAIEIPILTDSNEQTTVAGGHAHSVYGLYGYSDSSGGSEAFNNMQAYLSMNYIIKY